MLILFSTTLLVALMTLIGWFRGAIKMGGALVALLIASLLASPLHLLTAWLVRIFGVPELLVPLAATLCTGLMIFLAVLIPLSLWTKRHYGDELPSWDKPMGAGLGGVWGLLLSLFILAGVNTIARVDRAVRQANAEAEIRNEKRLKVERSVDKKLRPYSEDMSPPEYQAEKMRLVSKRMSKFKAKPEKIKEKMVSSQLDTFLTDLDDSALSYPLSKWSFVDERQEKVLHDLTLVVGDPILFDRFQKHPEVQTLMKEPALTQLSKDEEIDRAVREQRYSDLLDNPKIVKAARDPSIRRKVKKANVIQILDDVQQVKP